jgi:hypothetical protein
VKALRLPQTGPKRHEGDRMRCGTTINRHEAYLCSGGAVCGDGFDIASGGVLDACDDDVADCTDWVFCLDAIFNIAVRACIY